MRHGPVPVEQDEDRAGQKGTEDDLEPERLGQDGEADEQQEGAPDPDLGARVLQPREDGPQPLQASGGGERDGGGDHQQREGAEEQQPGPDAGRFPRKEQREQYDRPEVRYGGGDDELA